jgi:hypothetical protein
VSTSHSKHPVYLHCLLPQTNQCHLGLPRSSRKQWLRREVEGVRQGRWGGLNMSSPGRSDPGRVGGREEKGRKVKHSTMPQSHSILQKVPWLAGTGLQLSHCLEAWVLPSHSHLLSIPYDFSYGCLDSFCGVKGCSPGFHCHVLRYTAAHWSKS